MGMNEQETRYFLIDHILREKGYDDITKLRCETPAPVEPTGSKGRRRVGKGSFTLSTNRTFIQNADQVSKT
jgi:type I restriction enzyme, R subunit